MFILTGPRLFSVSQFPIALMASHQNVPQRSLAERFRSVMDQTQQSSEAADFTQLTLQELGKGMISFGEAKKGMTYEKVVQTDQSYVSWFTNKFAQSKKCEHQRLLHYIQKFVEQAKAAQGSTQPKSKAKPKSATMTALHGPAEEVEIHDTSEEEGSMRDLIEGQRQQTDHLEQNQGARIANLEMALNQIVGQLQDLTCHLKGTATQ